MNPLLLIKLLDLAMLGFTAYKRYQDNAGENARISAEMRDLQKQIAAGTVDEDAALAQIDGLIFELQSKMHAAVSRMPKPPGH